MKKSFCAILIVLLFTSFECLAAYTCTPENFTLENDGHSELHLKGSVKTPVTGYTYTLETDESESSASVLVATLNLLAPAGEAVLSETVLDIDGYLAAKSEDTKVVKIEVIKDFDTGPLNINCRSADAEKAPVAD